MPVTPHSRRWIALAMATVFAAVGLTLVASPATAAVKYTVSGHVSLGSAATSAGAGEVGIAVRSRDFQGQWFTSSVLYHTDSNGNYSLEVDEGSYIALNFEYEGTGNFVDGTTSTSNYYLDPSIILVDEPKSGVDITLGAGAGIAGIVQSLAGVPQAGVEAIAHQFDPFGIEIAQFLDTSDASGAFHIVGLPAGTYRLEFYDGRFLTPYARQWWQATSAHPEGAPAFPLAAAEERSGITASLTPSGGFTARVKCAECDTPAFETSSLFARVESYDAADDTWSQVDSASGGLFYSFNLLVGTYRIKVEYTGPLGYVNHVSPPFEVTGYDSLAQRHIWLTKTANQPTAFADIADGHAFQKEVEWMLFQLSNGYVEPVSGLRTYHPVEDVSRQAMAAFLYRFNSPEFVPPATPSFVDVPTSHQFFTEIEWLKAEGISVGTPAPGGVAFQPDDAVSRQAMAAFLYRLAGSPNFTPPAQPTFADVQPGQTFFAEIEWLKSTGITNGYPDGFHPVEPVSRQAMAAFLFRYVEYLIASS